MVEQWLRALEAFDENLFNGVRKQEPHIQTGALEIFKAVYLQLLGEEVLGEACKARANLIALLQPLQDADEDTESVSFEAVAEPAKHATLLDKVMNFFQTESPANVNLRQVSSQRLPSNSNR